jgi:Tfp pilus assembly PilM family ATPase
VGQRNVEITVLDRTHPVAYFETSVAGSLYVESLADVFQILPKEAALIFKGEVDNRYDDNLYRQTISNVTKRIVANIVEKLKKQNFGFKFENIDVIYVTGGCLKVRSLLDELVAKTNLPCLHLYPFKKIMDTAGNIITAEVGTQTSPFLGVATGLALRLVEKK